MPSPPTHTIVTWNYRNYRPFIIAFLISTDPISNLYVVRWHCKIKSQFDFQKLAVSPYLVLLALYLRLYHHIWHYIELHYFKLHRNTLNYVQCLIRMTPSHRKRMNSWVSQRARCWEISNLLVSCNQWTSEFALLYMVYFLLFIFIVILLFGFIYRPYVPTPWRVFCCASDRPFAIEHQVCSLRIKPQVSTTLHYTVTVCCNHTEHSQHCVPASVEARELNLKYARLTGELNPGPFPLAAECITTRPPRHL